MNDGIAIAIAIAMAIAIARYRINGPPFAGSADRGRDCGLRPLVMARLMLYLGHLLPARRYRSISGQEKPP